jgi:protein TonB
MVSFRGAALGMALVITTQLVASSASARDWPETAGWIIGENADSCSIFSEFEGKGDTQLLVMLHIDGSAFSSLTNTGWSAEKGKEYDIQWVLNGREYSGGSVGIGDGYYRNGFAAKFGPEFLTDFAKSPNLLVYRGDVVVDQLKLNGSAAALAVAQRCLQGVRRDHEAADRERRRFSHIADDPFARPPEKPTSDAPGGEARPIGNAARWATNDDYPAAALREGREGSTTFRVFVDPSGKVSKCEIVKSSGHADLDVSTCTLVQRRARFEMAPNAPTRTFEQTINWSIP